MGEKLKKNELPKSLNSMIDDDGRVLPYAPLVVDNYLDRAEVVGRIATRTGIDAPRSKYFSHEAMASLAIELVDDLTGTPREVMLDHPKCELIDLIGDTVGYTVHGEQDDMIKSQTVHILLTLVADEPPEPFQVPTDPDMETAETTRVPTLSD